MDRYSRPSAQHDRATAAPRKPGRCAHLVGLAARHGITAIDAQRVHRATFGEFAVHQDAGRRAVAELASVHVAPQRATAISAIVGFFAERLGRERT